MPRQIFSTECDELERVIHRHNVVCSGNLLAALQANHTADCSPQFVAPEPQPLPPIPNEMMAEASDIAADVAMGLPPTVGQIKRIQLAVLAEFPKITLIDFMANRRTRVVVWPRQIAMYLCKTLTRQSLPEIGRRFGGRDHTTVLHAVNKVTRCVESDPALAAQIDRLTQRIVGNA